MDEQLARAQLIEPFEEEIAAEFWQLIDEWDEMGATPLAEVRYQVGDSAVRLVRATPLGLAVALMSDHPDHGRYVSGEVRPWASVDLRVTYWWQDTDDGWQIEVHPGFGPGKHKDTVIAAGDAGHIRPLAVACLRQRDGR